MLSLQRATSHPLRPGALLLLLSVLLSAGCRHGLRNWSWNRQPAILAPEADVDTICRHLNVNILGTQEQPGLRSWQANHVTLNAHGIPMPATLAVEAPRNLRLRVSNPFSGGEVFDLGSNEDQFWLWARDSDPRGVILVRHDEVDIVSDYLDLPIDPDWLMEVFGVIPLNPHEYRLEPVGRGGRYVELIADRRAPNGEPMTKIVRVDLRQGVVVGHTLLDANGHVVGEATLSHHERDRVTGLMLAHQIKLEIAATGMVATVHMKTIQANPPPVAARVWQPPQTPGEPHIRLISLLPPEARLRSHQSPGTVLPSHGGSTPWEGAETPLVTPADYSGFGSTLSSQPWAEPRANPFSQNPSVPESVRPASSFELADPQSTNWSRWPAESTIPASPVESPAPDNSTSDPVPRPSSAGRAVLHDSRPAWADQETDAPPYRAGGTPWGNR